MSLKIAIIGAGGMAARHIQGFRLAGAEVVAIADKNEEAAKKTALRFQVEKTVSSAGKMYAKLKDLDAVSVITPNAFHYPLVMEALSHNKHVFCEKPPALNARETGEMAKAAAKKRKLLLFNFNNRARPESYAMMDYIKKGAVGKINSAQALWIRRTGIPGFGGWFTNKRLSGGGPLIDLVHMIDLALYFMGYPQPQHVLAQTFSDFIDNKAFKGPWGIPDVKNGKTDVESACLGFVRFKSGQVLMLRNSWAEMNRGEEVSVTFQGQKAGGRIQRLFRQDGNDDTAMDSCELYMQENGRSVNREIITAKDESMGRVRSASNFVYALEGKEPPLNTPDQAVALMKIVDAIYSSAKSGRPVEIK